MLAWSFQPALSGALSRHLCVYVWDCTPKRLDMCMTPSVLLLNLLLISRIAFGLMALGSSLQGPNLHSAESSATLPNFSRCAVCMLVLDFSVLNNVLSFPTCVRWHSFLPEFTHVTGYARSPMTDQELRDKLRPGLAGTDAQKDKFLSLCTYQSGAVRRGRTHIAPLVAHQSPFSLLHCTRPACPDVC